MILSLEKMKKEVRKLRRAGKRVVFTNGCFDIIHAGHVMVLGKAKALGDVLVVGVNSDASVRRLGKGEDRPINCLKDRSAVLDGLKAVDYVVSFSADTPIGIIKAISPDVLVKGGDWKKMAIVGWDFVEARGGKVVSIPLLPGRSTTNIIKQCRNK